MQKLSKLATTYKQNIIQEVYLEPVTAEKYGLTKRLIFRRRQRMQEKNLVIVYFDGVMGDIPYCSNMCMAYNTFRVRQGAIKDFRDLCFQHQVALVFPYASKRSEVLARYFHKILQLQVDGFYCLKLKEMKAPRRGYVGKWQDYD